MPSGLCQLSPSSVVEVRASRASRPPSDSGSPAKLFGTLMPASPSSGSGSPARRRPSRRSRRRRVRRGLPATITCAAPASRSAATASAPHSAYVGSAPARQTTGWPSYAASRASTPSVAPAVLDRDAAGGEAGWRRRSRGRCGPRRCRGWPGRPAAPPARRAAPRSWRRSGAPVGARRSAARSGSTSARFGNSVSPVIGRLRCGDLGLALRDGRGDLVVDGSSAVARSGRRLVPRRDGEVVGELLDGVRAAGRVGHVGDVRLGDQQVEVLRAIRRPNASGRPSGLSNGSTVTRRRPRRRRRTRRRWCAACSPRGRTCSSSAGW